MGSTYLGDDKLSLAVRGKPYQLVSAGAIPARSTDLDECWFKTGRKCPMKPDGWESRTIRLVRTT